MVLAPQAQLFFLGTYDAPLAQFLVTGYFPVRELPVFTEYDVETHPEDAQADYRYGKKEYFHLEALEIREQRLSGYSEHRGDLHHFESGAVAQADYTLDKGFVCS